MLVGLNAGVYQRVRFLELYEVDSTSTKSILAFISECVLCDGLPDGTSQKELWLSMFRDAVADQLGREGPPPDILSITGMDGAVSNRLRPVSHVCTGDIEYGTRYTGQSHAKYNTGHRLDHQPVLYPAWTRTGSLICFSCMPQLVMALVGKATASFKFKALDVTKKDVQAVSPLAWEHLPDLLGTRTTPAGGGPAAKANVSGSKAKKPLSTGDAKSKQPAAAFKAKAVSTGQGAGTSKDKPIAAKGNISKQPKYKPGNTVPVEQSRKRFGTIPGRSPDELRGCARKIEKRVSQTGVGLRFTEHIRDNKVSQPV